MGHEVWSSGQIFQMTLKILIWSSRNSGEGVEKGSQWVTGSGLQVRKIKNKEMTFKLSILSIWYSGEGVEKGSQWVTRSGLQASFFQMTLKISILFIWYSGKGVEKGSQRVTESGIQASIIFSNLDSVFEKDYSYKLIQGVKGFDPLF